MRELSSSLTLLYKYAVLPLWFAGFGLGTQEVLLAGPAEPRWLQYLVIWLLLSLFIFFSTAHIKKVSIQGKALVVSNFLKTETIPLAEIESVDGSTYLSPKLVWFVLKSPSVFGKKIVFIPARRMSPGIGKHPLVHELREELRLH